MRIIGLKGTIVEYRGNRLVRVGYKNFFTDKEIDKFVNSRDCIFDEHELYALHICCLYRSRRMLRIAYSVLKDNIVYIEDLKQTSFLILYETIEKYIESGRTEKFYSLYCGVFKNKLSQFHDKLKNRDKDRKELQNNDFNLDLISKVKKNNSPERNLLLEEIFEILHKNLSYRQFTVLMSKTGINTKLSDKELEIKFGISRNSLFRDLQKGIAKLKKNKDLYNLLNVSDIRSE